MGIAARQDAKSDSGRSAGAGSVVAGVVIGVLGLVAAIAALVAPTLLLASSPADYSVWQGSPAQALTLDSESRECACPDFGAPARTGEGDGILAARPPLPSRTSSSLSPLVTNDHRGPSDRRAYLLLTASAGRQAMRSPYGPETETILRINSPTMIGNTSPPGSHPSPGSRANGALPPEVGHRAGSSARSAR
jgi:hypothetical protein